MLNKVKAHPSNKLALLVLSLLPLQGGLAGPAAAVHPIKQSCKLF
jgi:hypothetical protein